MKTLEAEHENFRLIAQALSGELRIKILELLQGGRKNLNEISSALEIPLSTATVNIQKLEEAGLIITMHEPGKRGIQKLCSLAYDQVLFKLKGDSAAFEEITMPVGHYTQANITAPCGICTSEKLLGKVNDIRTFFMPQRIEGQLIWFSTGYLEYNFPNREDKSAPVSSIEITAELCSEVPYFNNKAESDITLWVNGSEVGLWQSPGDFGGKKGKLTPKWWGKHKTQFGMLVSWKISDEGSFCNGKKISDLTLDKLGITESPYVSIRLGVKADAEHARGMNIFGRGFGNHPQDILLRFNY